MMILNEKALSLTELVVASVLIGIIMVGVMTFSYSIKSIQDSSNRGSFVSSRNSAAFAHFRRNGMQAIGYTDDKGIRYDNNSGAYTNYYFSFRQDRSITPVDYDDDIWVIYHNDNTAGVMYTCEQSAANPLFQPSPHVPNRSAGNPCSPNQAIRLLSNISGISFNLIENKAALDFSFSISVTSMYDRTKPVHAIENPELTMSARINAPSHSF